MEKHFSFIHTIYSLSLALLLVVCSCRSSENEKGQPYILATTGMIGDILKNIAGDVITVKVLMQPGVDPHLYKASLGDLEKIMYADLIFYNGLYLEGKLSTIFEKQRRLKPTIGLGDYLDDPIKLGKDQYDPHIWFDVQNWISLSEATLDTLSKIYPENEKEFIINTEAYIKKLEKLDIWVRLKIKELPANRRIMVTAHDAFNYFGRAYGIEVRGLQGISTLTDFGLRDVSNLVTFIVNHNIPAVFVESSVSTRSLNAVISGAKSRGHLTEVGGFLFSDSMGEEGTVEGTYEGMIRHNVSTIVDALKN